MFIPPELAVTSTCSFFTSPPRSKTSRAADIVLWAPITQNSSSISTIPNAAFGALIASIIPGRSVIYAFNGPTTLAVLVAPEYPAKSITALLCLRASPSTASGKSAYLEVRVFAIVMIYESSMLLEGEAFDIDRSILGSFLY